MQAKVGQESGVSVKSSFDGVFNFPEKMNAQALLKFRMAFEQQIQQFQRCIGRADGRIESPQIRQVNAPGFKCGKV